MILVTNLAIFGLILRANEDIGTGYEITSSLFISFFASEFQITTEPASSDSKSSSHVAGLTNTWM